MTESRTNLSASSRTRLLAAMLLLGGAFAAGWATLDEAQAHSPRYVKRIVYECQEGWWSVRDGSPHTYPSDGKRRPAWFQRCRQVIVSVEK